MHAKNRSPMSASQASSSISRVFTPTTWRGREFEVVYTKRWMELPSAMTERHPGGPARPPWEWTSAWNDYHISLSQETSSIPSMIAATTPTTPSDTDHSHHSSMVIDKLMYDTYEDLFGSLLSTEDTSSTSWHVLMRPRRKDIGECSEDSEYSSFLDKIDAETLVEDLNFDDFDSRDSEDEELPQSALPGLNMAMNLATTTQAEFDLFRDLAPPDLRDPLALMDTVSKKRDEMMGHSARPGDSTP